MAAGRSFISNGSEYVPLDLKKGELSFALAPFNPHPNVHTEGLSPQEVKEIVKGSTRLKAMIKEISVSNGVSEESVVKLVDEIVDEIGHKMALPAVRTVAMIIRGTLRRVISGIYIEKQGLEELGAAVKRYPVVILPSHRSYLDFILVSYFLLENNIQLPAIAAGQDFMNMKVISSLLRRSGAFFMRRTFGSDRLYKLIFTVYMQTVLTNRQNPIEFFIEGTRSRTAKTLHPKLGLLSMIVEPYLHGLVDDVLLAPLSISYERTLEESLFARELLGIPKPKESTSGLFKAKSLLFTSYGSIFVDFSKQISLHEFCIKNGISRIPHGIQPRNDFSFLPGEREMVLELGYQILHKINKKMKIFPSSILSSLLLHFNNGGVERDKLINWMDVLKAEIEKRGGIVHWNNDNSAAVFDHCVNLLLSSGCIRIKDGRIEIAKVEEETRLRHKEGCTVFDIMSAQMTSSALANTLNNGYTELILGHYRNQLIHWFISESIMLTCINGISDIELDVLKKRFILLSQSLCKEFILPPGPMEKVFDDTLHCLIDRGLIEISGSLIFIVSNEKQEVLSSLLSGLIRPFVAGVWVMCLYLESLMGGVQSLKLTLRNTQQLAAKLIHNGFIDSHEILSLDIYKNTIASFNVTGILFEPELELEGRDRLVKVLNAPKLKELTFEIGAVLFNGSPPVSINNFSKL
ncbi:PREDICTED: dihydroxyacetone phosphate acyltransferase-like [Amphimedon queenslandica]|uniref:Phospholipid/glycerol acyltransferase domain-containing protein n=1 Tax=Amphimedon queenslandica TaxID=400682 RepID=A0AAN0IXL4_AMPQE|nr:PREDICTED: dihydroxyacetone phosphate acyltransferase-like [Amphimedon queenslandica]|eukprot:XP_019849514.1 PREDICTED: dihydroxyacetone phosphate acyltransferase-like [Amphimedon queenslandica]